MKTFFSVVVLLISLAFFTGEAISGSFDDIKAPPSKEQREKIRKRIETLKMWKLTKILDLDEESAARFFPLINKYDKKRAVVAEKMEKDMRKLRRSIEIVSEEELSAIIKRLEYNHRRLQEINQEELERFKSMLTTREMAKLIIFKHDFDRDMKKIIAEVKERRARKRLRDRHKEPPHE